MSQVKKTRNAQPSGSAPAAGAINAQAQNADYAARIEAIGRQQAVIEFTMDGKVMNANENFLAVMGYRLDEIQGQHHGMFVDPAHRQSVEYRLFWEKLGRGEYDAGEYKRLSSRLGFADEEQDSYCAAWGDCELF